MAKIFGAHMKGPETSENSTLVFTTEAMGTSPTLNFKTQRDKDYLVVSGYVILSSGTTGASARIVLPAGYLIDTAKMLANKSQRIGAWHDLEGANSTQSIAGFGPMIFDNSDGGNNGVGLAFQLTTPLFRNYMGGTSIGSPGAGLSVEFRVPIIGWSANDVLRISDDSKI